MKTLIDKIIECLNDKNDHWIGKQTNEVTQAENKGFKQGLEWAIGKIESLESSAEFEEVALVLVKHINKYHPHHTIIIDATHAELLEGEKVMECFDYIKD